MFVELRLRTELFRFPYPGRYSLPCRDRCRCGSMSSPHQEPAETRRPQSLSSCHGEREICYRLAARRGLHFNNLPSVPEEKDLVHSDIRDDSFASIVREFRKVAMKQGTSEKGANKKGSRGTGGLLAAN